ncbi:MAG: flagellar assembly protein FliW [Myxococcales bacterium]|nr:flagellar assembly protein FliW [Myxococcales bacterium]
MNTTNKIRVTSARFGEVEISEEQVINFPSGIAGFDMLKTWCLLHLEDAPDYNWLQSLDEPGIALLLADPDQLFQGYVADVREEQVGELKLADDEGVVPSLVMRVVLKWDEQKRRFFANLRAPIIFNLDNRLAVQVILQKADYSMFEEIKTLNEGLEEAKEQTADALMSSGEGHAEARI